MVTKYQVSLLLILDQFDKATPITIRQALENIGNDELAGISLHFRPVALFVKNNLAHNRYLDEKDGGYVISRLGLRERNKLVDSVGSHRIK